MGGKENHMFKTSLQLNRGKQLKVLGSVQERYRDIKKLIRIYN